MQIKIISFTKIKEITYKENFFTISYVSIDYNVPEKIQYKYLMEGFDRDWVNAGNKREATYMNLDPGSYIFKVKASNNDELWNYIPTELKIVILPPWWQTWWFRISLAIFLLLSILAFYFWRINSFKQQHRVLEKTVWIGQPNSDR